MKYFGEIVNDKDLVTKEYVDRYAQLSGASFTGPVTFGDSVTIDEATLGDLVVNGSASFTNNIQVNTINGVAVGSDPKFTDTDTKVTSSANHYTPSTASGNDKTASASGATAAWSIDVVKGITINTDGKGHITGLSVTSGKIPSNPNTDIKVKQLAAITTAGAYPIILAYSTATTEETNSVNKTSTLTYNPNTKALVTGGTVDGYTLAAASAKSVVTSIDTSASLPTSNAVKTFVENKGYTTNTGTVTQVTAGTGLSIGTTAGGNFTTSGTINHTNSVTAQTTQAIYPIKIDAQGHISAYGSAVTPLTSHQTIKQDGVTGATGNHFSTCSVAAGTAAKTVSITAGTPALEAGLRVTVKFANANTAGTPTLNVNSLGAKNIFHNGAQITTGANKALLAGTVEFVYDGTQWQLVGNYVDTDTKAWSSITGKPTATASATTGITASTTATKTTLGTAGSVTGVQSTTTTASKVTLGTAFSIAGVSGSVSVRGVKTGDNSTTTASKVTVGSHSTDYGVKSAGSGSFTQGTFTGGSLVVTNHVLSFTPATHGADSHTHTAPTLGSKVPTVSASDITVPIRADADTTVPKAATAVSIPNVTGATDVTVPIKNTSATSIPNVSVASATVSITDPGHTHDI